MAVQLYCKSRGFSNAKKFIHGGVEFFGWRRVSDVVVIVLGFGGGNMFLDFLFLINFLMVSFVERHQRSSHWCLCLAWLISGVYQGVYGQLGRRCVVMGSCSSKSWQMQHPLTQHTVKILLPQQGHILGSQQHWTHWSEVSFYFSQYFLVWATSDCVTITQKLTQGCLRTIKLHCKQIHISKLISYINPFSSPSIKPIPTQT